MFTVSTCSENNIIKSSNVFSSCVCACVVWMWSYMKPVSWLTVTRRAEGTTTAARSLIQRRICGFNTSFFHAHVELPACFSLRLRDGRLHHSPPLTLPTGCVSCTLSTRHARDCGAHVSAVGEQQHQLAVLASSGVFLAFHSDFISELDRWSLCNLSLMTLHALL